MQTQNSENDCDVRREAVCFQLWCFGRRLVGLSSRESFVWLEMTTKSGRGDDRLAGSWRFTPISAACFKLSAAKTAYSPLSPYGTRLGRRSGCSPLKQSRDSQERALIFSTGTRGSMDGDGLEIANKDKNGRKDKERRYGTVNRICPPSQNSEQETPGVSAAQRMYRPK